MRLALLILVSLSAMGQTRSEPGDSEKTPIPVLHQSIVITASPVEPSLDRRNAEVFTRTLFSRDDQIFHVLDAGINAGQHEGGGKSLEIRRFGFNLDHGGVSGGLKVLVDNVQQNQTTQGHGQGYLGSLKSLTPELVQEVNMINGPFSAEYGDFSGLGVVHVRLRESLPDQLTVRLQGGSFNTARGFLAYSPTLKNGDAFLAYEGSSTGGPFQAPLGYRRDNLTANFTRRLPAARSVGFRFNGGRNTYLSSGQIPLDEVAARRLDRFGLLDPNNGGRVRSATVAMYLRQEGAAGQVWKLDGFVSRSLFDMYSNFTFFLNDPVNGDGIQQHDSRLQEGANAQYLRPHRAGGVQGLLTAGANFHDNQILAGLYPALDRVPLGVATRANVRVINGAGYIQESFSLLDGRLLMGGGLRYDAFRFDVRDRLSPELSGAQPAGRVQPKAHVAFTPSRAIPLTLHANYGRGISTSDARAVVQQIGGPRIATTDFYQLGTSHHFGRFSLSAGGFWIDRSHERVYIPDDGSFEFKGPSRAYGFETKASVSLTRALSLNGGLTKVANAFYRGTFPRVYVDSAPHFVANAGLTLSYWKGWSGSLRMRAINHYRLDGEDPAILAAGHTVFDLSLSRRLRRGVELNFAVDNLANRDYYETQNYFESRLAGQDARPRIHATPGYGTTVTAGLTFRLWSK
ncbi:MAG: TonB-dependent receptor [Bryobacteraceae bacterium]